MSCLFLCAVKTRRDYSLILYLKHRIFSVNPGIILTMLTFETTLGQVSCPAVIVFVVTRAWYVSQEMGELEILILRKIWRPSLSPWKKRFSCLFYWEYMQPWLGQCYNVTWYLPGGLCKDPIQNMAAVSVMTRQSVWQWGKQLGSWRVTLLGDQLGVRTEDQDIITVAGGPTYRVIFPTYPSQSQSSFSLIVHDFISPQFVRRSVEVTPMSRSILISQSVWTSPNFFRDELNEPLPM